MKIKFLLLLIVMCSCENKPQTFLDLFSNSISKEWWFKTTFQLIH